MKKYGSIFCFIVFILTFNTGCTSTSVKSNVLASDQSSNTLVVYADGRMELNSRFVNKEDVVIYADGRGGERAAIKVRVPIHSDFYRDSIIVVRVQKQHSQIIAEEKSELIKSDIIN